MIRLRNDEDDSSPNKRLVKKRREDARDWNKWFSASSTRNFLIKDPLLDWLNFHSLSLAVKKPSYARFIKNVNARQVNNFTEFIMAQGNEFESKVMEFLYKRHKNLIYDVGGNSNARSEEKMEDTIRAMNKGIPIIYQGVLHNSDNQTYGVPDLIVRSDWLKELVKTNPIQSVYENISASLLKTPYDDKPPNYHYCIVDIKFTTLKLRADGIHLLNSGSVPAFKSQLYVYNLALGKIQGYTPHCAYILGRKWSFKTKNLTTKGNSCVDKLGIINYDEVDIEFVKKTNDALAWLKDMRENGDKWDLTSAPLCKAELYPNMSNMQDYPWHEVKKELAKEIGEITSLWMCGVKNRVNSHAHGIYSWKDERCNTDTLGVFGPKISKTLKKILDINRSETHALVEPPLIINNDCNWQKRKDLEFYVDFEFVNDIVSDFTQMPRVEAEPIIFMIGVGHFDIVSNNWIYRDFTVSSLDLEEEDRICTEFSMYIRAEAHFYDCESPLLIHWSNAEKWQWSKAYGKHKGSEKGWIPPVLDEEEKGPRWFDMLKVFKEEPIVIKNCMGFGLKEVANTLSNHGFFELEKDESTMDGASAMLGAFKSSKDAKSRGISLKEMPLIREIIKYNEKDCKMVGEVTFYIRKFHTNYVEEPEDEVILYD